MNTVGGNFGTFTVQSSFNMIRKKFNSSFLNLCKLNYSFIDLQFVVITAIAEIC